MSPPGTRRRPPPSAVATRAAGLSVCSYGTYFKLDRDNPADFPPYLDSAEALGTTVLRLWCGIHGSADTDRDTARRMAEDARTVTALAARRGMTVCFECHPNTMADDYTAALAFLRETAADGAAPRMYFQPNQNRDRAYNLAAVRALRPCTEVVHVFNWKNGEKLPLAAGADEWRDYIRIFGTSLPYLLEFMPDGALGTLAREGATLSALLHEAADN